MTTITFTHGATINVESVYLNTQGDTIFAGNGTASYDAYELFGIKSIIPPKQETPTALQSKVMEQLRLDGYRWDKQHSTAAACVILKRADGDFWLFGLEGEIMHNPEALLSIKL